MPELLAIADTSPLLYLHSANCLDLLRKLYGEVIVPPGVLQELEAGEAQGVDVPDITSMEWMKIQPITSPNLIPALVDLGQGEAEVLALGIENPSSLLIFDDQLARRIASLYKLKYTGTLGILIKAKKSGYLSSIAPVIMKLRNQGMWLTDEIVNHVLDLAEEL